MAFPQHNPLKKKKKKKSCVFRVAVNLGVRTSSDMPIDSYGPFLSYSKLYQYLYLLYVFEDSEKVTAHQKMMFDFLGKVLLLHGSIESHAGHLQVSSSEFSVSA